MPFFLNPFTGSFDFFKTFTLNGLTSATQLFANDTNVTITSVDSTHTLGWSGKLSLARGGTNADLSATGGTGKYLKQASTGAAITVSSITASEITAGAALTKTDDTNVTLTLGGTPTTALLTAASITVGWAGTLAAARLNSNVVQGITNDTNVTGTIAAQVLTLGWTGQLAISRGGTNASTATTAFNNLSPMTTLGDIIYGGASGVGTRLAGNITTTRKFFRQTGDGAISAAPAWDTILAADIPASALTRVNDTNVTLTLGGTPNSSLLAATSLTLGWTGTLAATRGGTGSTSFSAGSVIFSNGTILTEDNANFFWDDTNNRLGLGTTTPTAPLDVRSVTTGQSLIASGLIVNNGSGNATTDSFQVNGGTISSLFLVKANTDQLSIGDGGHIVLGSTTGTKFGTATTQKIGFFNKTPVVQPSAYTPTNVTTDRSYDANATTLDEVADVLGTLISDLQSLGLIG